MYFFLTLFKYLSLSPSFLVCVSVCVGRKLHLANLPGALDPPSPGSIPVSSQKLQDVFLEARQLGYGVLAQRRARPGVLGGLNHVFCKFRWSGTEWLFSAQFKMIGLTPPGPSPFRSTADFSTTQKQLWAPQCQPSRCVLREERPIYKVPSTSVPFKCKLQEYWQRWGAGSHNSPHSPWCHDSIRSSTPPLCKPRGRAAPLPRSGQLPVRPSW